MKVTDPNLSSLASTSPAAPQGGGAVQSLSRTSSHSGAGVTGTGDAASSDGVHLSELVRSLRSLAADSPERQMRMEQIARSAANGSYNVNAQGTAFKIVDDALQRL
jgi:anti-sigma28 factor (negative regulator of flagellin synthesis)